jgi:hypothetical protein
MKRIIPILFLLFNLHIHAQNISVEWFTNAGGENFDAIYNMQQDAEENIILTGVISGNAYFEDHKIGTAEKNGIYIAKYSPDGELIWIKHIQSSGEVSSESLSLSNKGEIYICGSFKKSLTVGSTTMESTDFSDNYIAKFDENGEVLWSKHIITDTKGHKTILACDNEDHIYYTGTFYDDVDFSAKKINSQSGADIFLAKYNSKGEFVDAIAFTGFKAENVNDLHIPNTGELYITGSFTEELSVQDKTIQSSGKTDVFLTKFKDLNLEWVKSYGGFHKDYGEKILVKNDIVYVTGCFSGKAKFYDIELISKGVYDAFVTAHDAKGNLLWANRFGGYSNDYVSSVGINRNNSIYITGSYRGQLGNVNEDVISNNFSSDIYSAKFTSAGDFIGAYSLGGEHHDFASDILIDSENYIYHTINFDKDFTIKDKEKSTGQGRDLLITKYYDCDAAPQLYLGEDVELYSKHFTIIPNNEFEEYEWNTGSTDKELTVYKSGEYSLIVTDENNCVFEDTIRVTFFNEPFDEMITEEDDKVDELNQFTCSLYPNPGKDKFYLNLDKLNIQEKLLIRISDENGRIVYLEESSLFSDQVLKEINLTNISAGIFEVLIENGEVSLSKSLVVYK